jgi:predicted HicB family RNase H-like nuclease
MDKRKAAARVVVAPPVRVFSQLGIRLPADLAVRLRTFALSSGLSLNAIATTALTRFLDQEQSDRPPR